MPETSPASRKFTGSGLLSGICGLLCTALGAVVLTGWHTGNAFLVRIQAGFVPMQYLTAVCFFLSGVGLISLAMRLPRLLPVACGALTGVMGLLLSVEYLTGGKLGLSALLRLLPQIPGLWAGWPSTSTAAGFALAGTGILLLPAMAPGSAKRLIIWMLGSSAVALGLMALCAYRLGVKMMFAPDDPIRMAAHSAGGLVVLGIGLLSAQWAGSRRLIEDRWLPVPIGLGCMVAALMMWQALTADRIRSVREQAKVIADNVAADTFSRFTFCIRSLERIARRWEAGGRAPYPQWFGDAWDCFQDQAVFEAVGHTDADWKVDYVELDKDAEPLLGHDLRSGTPWPAAEALRDSITNRRMLISPVVAVRGSDKGFFVFFPTFSENEFRGFVFASFRLEDLKDSTLDQTTFATCRISLFEGDKFILGELPVEPGNVRTWAESIIEFRGHVWRFVAEPGPGMLAGGKLPLMILWLGVLLGGALSAAMWAFQEAVSRTRMALAANRQLKEEIDERQLAERNLRDAAGLLRQRNRELEAATARAEAHARAKAEFLANMSHEIRTPLNAVIGMSEMLIEGQLDAREREFVKTIHSSGEVLLSLINDILDFSKIESGQLDLENIPLHLGDCMESVLDLLARQAARKNLDLMGWIDPALPAAVLGDPTRLRQVLVNLVSNAVKFTSRGEVCIKLSMRRNADGPWLHAAVTDTGIGIPAEGMHRLFGVFSQVDASTTRRFGGTGLGLAISQRLIRNMGGRIWGESEVGKGSSFQFMIPLHPVDFPASASQAPEGMKGMRVLIVDDNATHRWILSMRIQAWHMIPTAAAGAPEALERIRNGEKFDLAIIDAMMPEMDGYALAAGMREHHGGSELRILILASMEDSHRDPAPMGISVLNKPLKAGPLLHALRNTLASTSTAAPKPPPDPAGEGEMPGTSRPLRILVAEDNPVNQKVVALHLQRMGYQSVMVGNGLEAVQAVQEREFDVLLMDVQMPEMDGLEAAREICRRQPPAGRPWMIALTANAFGGDRDDCLAAGMNDYLSKPVRGDGLQRALRSAFEERLGKSSGKASF
ncbi:MAG: response regulator [Verrucomicrobiota bacterium]